MNPMTGPSLVGIITSMFIIYWIHPINNGAIALVVVLCVGISLSLAKLFKRSTEGTQKK